MSARKPEDKPSTSQMKGRTIDDEVQPPNVMAEEAPKQLAIVAAPNEENDEPRPQIFKLDVDCVQEMFDWLPITDIHSVSETCTRMQRIVGDYFQPHLAALKLVYDGEFKTFHGNVIVNGFKEFVQKLEIRARVNDDAYRFISLHCKSLKQIIFFVSRLTPSIIEYMKPILKEIESVKLLNVEGEFYERFLQFCPNLNHLFIKSVNMNGMIVGVNNAWLRRSYPALEHLELRTRRKMEIPELGTFFEQNAGLKTLSISDDVFLNNINTMLQTKITLQVLALGLYEDEEPIYHNLNQLYDRGFYRRLHLNMFSCDQLVIDKVVALNGLDKLYLNLSNDSPKLNLNAFIHLRELGLNYTVSSDPFPIDLQSTAKSLVNLERIYFDSTKSEIIEPFIQYSATLKAIKIDYLNEEFLDLSSLNKKREQLTEAGRVTIYLEEKLFLATKWNNKTIDFEKIEVKRAESYDWYMPFSFY